MKRAYIPPKVKTEKVELGVFGCYGSGGGDIWEQWTPFRFITSLFKVLCCN
jgi:hypothetical protein